MNKGMIMEVKKSYAIALNDKGFMEKIISKENMEVGQKIFYFEDDIVKATTSKVHRHNNFIKAFGSIAALFLLVFTFFNTMKYEQAYAVVSLDINPSIQIEADSKQMIIKVEGVNDDGKDIDFSDIKDVSINDGIQKIKEKLIEKQYLDTNNEVLYSAAFENDGDNSSYEETLQNAIRSTFNTEDITYIKANKEEVEEAKAEGISLGRYKAKEAASVDQETKKNIGKAPVKEITALIKDNENVIQWEAKDEKVVGETPIVGNKPVTNTNPQGQISEPVKERPIINVPTEGHKPNTEIEGEQGNNTRPIVDKVLELEPEVPAQGGKNEGSTSTPPKDSNIIIEPNNGTIENNTTSGKIQEDPNKISKEPAKTEEPLENKDTIK